MARNREGRPAWFKFFIHTLPVIEAVTDEAAGIALKALLQYANTREDQMLAGEAKIVYAACKQYVDEAYAEYQKASEAGKKGNKTRWRSEASGGDTL